jgi:glycosyltransferase involved in cell wall biosynthesis
MISVCIPVYNVDVKGLVESLLEQAGNLDLEIILIDDGSSGRYLEANRELKDERLTYRELGKNIGRSKIRNRFSEMARYPYLLFMDCDSVIVSGDFLVDYFHAIREFPEKVICGGRIYSDEPPSHPYRLHWKYGNLRESRSAKTRGMHPHRSFMTNNFILPAKVLRKIAFNEKLAGYGHEDSLYGYQLYKNGVEIRHIDNPVLHGKLETNREFLTKTEAAVHNLSLITSQMEKSPVFAATISLLRTAGAVRNSGLVSPLLAMHYLSRPSIRWLLSHGFTSLNLLDFHKLGTYLRDERRNARLDIRR